MLRSKRLGSDERAQMFMLEVITSGLLIIAAINFITTLPAPSQESTLHLHKWTVEGKDVLRALDNLPSPGFASRLDEGVCKNISIILDELDMSLPQTLSFNIYLRDQSMTITLYYSGIPDKSSSARVNYIAYFTGGGSNSFICQDWSDPTSLKWKETETGIYEISIILWHEARGWSE